MDEDEIAQREATRARLREEEAAFRQEHAGHEAMHMEMLFIVLSVTVVAQLLLVLWQKKHFSSYRAVTLVAMWQMPLWFWLYHGSYHLLLVWGVFTGCTGYVSSQASQRPILSTTPRFVYKYFLIVYKICYFTGVFGYIIFLLQFFGIFSVLSLAWRKFIIKYALLFLLHGLYYGCLVRDFAEICAERMTSSIGFYAISGIPSKKLPDNGSCCSVCGQSFSQEYIDDTVSLDCGHKAHDFCIRGWCIVGKKASCPYCKEKVDLKKLQKAPWTDQDVRFAVLLDWVRYLVAWQPLIVIVSRMSIKAFGLH